MLYFLIEIYYTSIQFSLLSIWEEEEWVNDNGIS